MHERGIPVRSIVGAVLGAAAGFVLAHAAPPASSAPPGVVPRGLPELSALFSPSGFTDGYWTGQGSGEWHVRLPDGRTVSAAGRAWTEETGGSGR